MFRRKHRSDNLKQEREKIRQYLQSFLSRARDPEYRDPGKGKTARGASVHVSLKRFLGQFRDRRNMAEVITDLSGSVRTRIKLVFIRRM